MTGKDGREMILTYDLTELEISAKGGTISRWQHGGTHVFFPQQRLFVNGELKRRGGMPLCVPIHGTPPKEWVARGLEQHGFARDLPGEFRRHGMEDLRQAMAGYRIWEAGQVNRPDFPWHLHCNSAVVIQEGGFVHQLVVANRLDSASDDPMPIAPGLHPYFSSPGGEWHLRHGDRLLHHHELPLGESEAWELKPAEPVFLLTRLGRVVIQPVAPYEGIVIWRDHKNYVCVEPITRRSIFGTERGINLYPGDSRWFACTFIFEPYEEE